MDKSAEQFRAALEGMRAEGVAPARTELSSREGEPQHHSRFEAKEVRSQKLLFRRPRPH